jgi:hypothetical protein
LKSVNVPKYTSILEESLEHVVHFGVDLLHLFVMCEATFPTLEMLDKRGDGGEVSLALRTAEVHRVQDMTDHHVGDPWKSWVSLYDYLQSHFIIRIDLLDAVCVYWTGDMAIGIPFDHGFCDPAKTFRL